VGKTRHFQARMSQRAIDQELVSLVLGFGSPEPDGKIVLNRKSLEALCERLTKLRQDAQKALHKGGLVVVEEGGKLITTYRLDSYNRATVA
jgi:hypothetical protein